MKDDELVLMKLGPVKLRFWVLLMRKQPQQEEFHGLIEELKLLRLGSISEEVKKSFQRAHQSTAASA